MSRVHNSDWVEIGSGVELRFLEQETTNKESFCATVKEYDMIEIHLQHPENFPVAVDTGKAPRIIRQENRSDAVLMAQISEVHNFEKVLQIRCDCYDEFSGNYYIAEIAISYEAPLQAPISLKSSDKLKNFGAPAPNMDAAFRTFFASLHPKD